MNNLVFKNKNDKKKYYTYFNVFLILSCIFSILLLTYKNPIPISSPSFIPVINRRFNLVITLGIIAITQSMATISFQTIVSNRIITPSLLGFEAIYSCIHTALIFFYGQNVFNRFVGIVPFFIQVIIMVMICILIYSIFLRKNISDIHLMLLFGMIIGIGLKSISSFMRRMLTPSEFDILQAKMYGSVNNADPSYFPIVIPIILILAIVLFKMSSKLNIMALGNNNAKMLGIDTKSYVVILVIISIFMAISTSMIGSLNFFGFLISAIIYEICPTYNHKHIFSLAILLAMFILSLSYFLMYYVFSAQGVVGVLIELIGGIYFLMIIRKYKQ